MDMIIVINMNIW